MPVPDERDSKMQTKKQKELDAKWKIVATKAVTDDKFRKKLVADPVAVMTELGLAVPEGLQVKAGTGGFLKVMLPKDASDDLMKEAKWLSMRLDIIREFGAEDKKFEAKLIVMTAQESDGDEI